MGEYKNILCKFLESKIFYGYPVKFQKLVPTMTPSGLYLSLKTGIYGGQLHVGADDSFHPKQCLSSITFTCDAF